MGLGAYESVPPNKTSWRRPCTSPRMVLTPFRVDNNFAPHFKIQSAAVESYRVVCGSTHQAIENKKIVQRSTYDPLTCKHLRTRFDILAAKLEGTDGRIRDHADLRCVSSCARLVAVCLSGSCWTIDHSSSIGFRSELFPGHSPFSPRSAGGCLGTTAGLWRSDALEPRPAWRWLLIFQPLNFGLFRIL